MRQLHKSLLATFISCFVTCLVLAGVVKCTGCGYENDSSDRYCLECATEIRTMTTAEKKQADAWAKEQAAKKPAKALGRKGAQQPKIQTIVTDGSRVDLARHAVKGSVTIFDFYADWCGPCKSLSAKLDPYVQKTKGVYLRKINIVSWSSPVAKQYNLRSIPSITIYNQNKKRAAEKLSNDFSRIKNQVEKLLK